MKIRILQRQRCIGGRHTQTSRWPTHEDYVRDSVEITVAAANAIVKDVVPTLQEKPFRFVFCSGDSTELDPDKSLWILEMTRKVKVSVHRCIRKAFEWLICFKGQAENGLYQLADENLGEFEVYSVRPCGIYQTKPRIKDWILTTFVLPSLRVEALAAVMVKVGKTGYDKRIIVHQEAKEVGEQLLRSGNEMSPGTS